MLYVHRYNVALVTTDVHSSGNTLREWVKEFNPVFRVNTVCPTYLETVGPK
jgi:hypothetical protein